MTEEQHIHHWKIDPPEMTGKSQGVCIRCGESRFFENDEQVSFLPWKREPRKKEK